MVGCDEGEGKSASARLTRVHIFGLSLYVMNLDHVPYLSQAVGNPFISIVQTSSRRIGWRGLTTCPLREYDWQGVSLQGIEDSFCSEADVKYPILRERNIMCGLNIIPRPYCSRVGTCWLAPQNASAAKGMRVKFKFAS